MVKLSMKRGLPAASADSRARVLWISLLVSAICALLVSTTYVLLGPKIDANLAAERQARLDAMIATLPGLEDLIRQTGADTLQSVVVDLRTGTEAEDSPDILEPEVLTASDETSSEIAPTADIADLGRRPDFAEIFVLRTGRDLALAVFPVYGKGYQSTIKAYVALEGDLNTIAGFTVIEQGETPGLGANIGEAEWQAKWPGKELTDADGVLRIEVVRGQAQTSFEVDGVTGATRTGDGISSMMQFWFGPDGYGRVLEAMRSGEL